MASKLSRSPYTPDVPEYLLEAYLQAVRVASGLVTPVLRQAGNPSRTWGLRAVRPAFEGDWELALRYWTGEVPVPEE